MKRSMISYFGALVRVLQGSRDGAAIGKALAAVLIVCLAVLTLSVATVKVWATCADYFAAEEIELPFVCTELADYPGGATAYMFAFGFQPGEQVELQVIRADGLLPDDPAYDPWIATADAEGNVATMWTVCTDCVDQVLRLYAYGLTSGLMADTIFTDAISPAIGVAGCAPYSQNFDALASSGTSSTTPSGWGLVESGSSANTTYTAGTGSGTAGDTYSFGAASNAERAFGALQSGSVIPAIGAQFINNSGLTITALKIQYTGEQWRLGATGRPDQLDFQYSLNATALNNGSWTDFDALDFVAPITAGTVGALDGNAAANRTLKSATISGLSIPAGATFFIRWSDFNATGADDGLAVDNFILTPIAATITAQPAGQSSCVGGSASFTVGVSGPTSYAWRKRGSGWGAGGWSINDGNGGHFIGASTGNGGSPSIGTAWGLWNNGGTTTEASRPFNGSMAIGQTFTIDMDNGGVDNSGGAVGFGLRNAANQNRLEFYFRQGQANYKLSAGAGEVDTGLGWSQGGLRVAFTLTGADSFALTITRLENNQTAYFTGTLAGNAASAITYLRIFNYNAGSGGGRDAFFNNIAFDGRDDNAGNAPYADGWQGGDDGGQAPLANGGSISGATTATLTISPVSAGSVGSYDVVIGECQQTISSEASLTATSDTTPPTVVCPPDSAVSVDANCQATIPDVLAGVTASDNCGTITSLTQSPAAGTVVGTGAHTITVTATDGSGNAGTCTTVFTASDTTAPVVICPTFPPITPGAGCQAVVPEMVNIADSVNDFGPQGQGNWWYGSTLSFDAGSFVPLLSWDGSKHFGSGCYNTPYLTVSHGHPGVGGCDGFSSWRWATRRYVAEAAGTFRVKGEFGDGDLGCNSGDGVTLYIRLNNVNQSFNVIGTGNVPSWNINPNDGTRQYWLDVTLSAGDVLDFAIAPRFDQGCDDTYWTHNLRPLVTDNCGVNQPPSAPAISQSPAAGTIITGTTPVTLQVTDAAGNVGTCTSVLNVQDTTPPTISCPGDITVTCAGDDPGSSFAGGSASDNCGTPAVTVQSDTVASGGCANQYVRTVVFMATDPAGLTATCTRTITVNDTVPPTLGAPGADATIECPAVPAFTAPAASDNCGAASVVEVSDVTTPGACAGAYSQTKTWKAVDACGNESAPVSQTITVQDTTAPTLGAPGADATIECPAVPAFTAPAASDNCGAASVVEVSDVTTPGACAGAYSQTKTWKAVDACGNESAPVSQTITVQDTTPPVITCPANAAVGCNDPTDPGATGTATASDSCDGMPSVSHVDGGLSLPTDLFISEYVEGSSNNKYLEIFNGTGAPVNLGLYNVAIYVNGSTAASPVINLSGTLANGAVYVIKNSSATIWSGTANLSSGSLTFNGNDAVALRKGTVLVDVIGRIGQDPGATGWGTDPANTTDNTILRRNTVVSGDSNGGDAFNPAVEWTGYPIDSISGLGAHALASASVIYRTWTATDACGNSASCIQTISVSDTTPPVLSGCPAETVAVQCIADVPSPAAVTALDGCDGAVTVQYSQTPATLPASSCNVTITRTWTAKDSQNNTASCQQVITVNDTIAPVLSGVPADAVVECDAIPAAPAVTALDNCAGSVAVAFHETVAAGACGTAKTLTRTWSATDPCGNVASASQVLTVQDTTAPVVIAPPNRTLQVPALTTVAANGSATATDNCDTLAAGDPVPPVWINEFHYDNSGTDIGEFIEIAGPEGFDLSGAQLVLYNGANGTIYTTISLSGVIDDEGQGFGALTFPASGLQNGAPDGFALALSYGGTLVQFLSYEGSFVAVSGPATGETSEDVGVLEGESTLAGYSLQLLGSGAGYGDFVWTGPLLSSPGSLNAGQDIASGGLVITHSDSEVPGCGNTKTITRTWTATDACGNSGSEVQTITTIDSIAPVLAGVPADETVSCDAIPAAAAVTASDNSGLPQTVVLDEDNSVVNGCGTIVRTWTATDACGNSTTASQTLTVEDTVAPVLAGVPADETVSCEAIPAAAIVTVSDNCDTTVAVVFSESDSVVEGCGTIVRTWTATDACGNAVTASQTLTVEDTAAPELVGVPDSVLVSCDAIPAAAIVTASDTCDSTLTVDFSETSDVVEGCGTIVRTWTVTDSCGNSTSAEQTIDVEDVEAPVLAGVPADETVACDAIPTAAIVTASDNCDSTLTVDFSETSDVVEGCGTIVRTWTVTDECANTAEASQTLTVEDTVAPVLAGVPADETVACDAIPAAAIVTAADNCDPTLVVDFAEVNSVVEGCGTIVRTWTVADNCGNSATASQTLTVEDTVAPVLAGVPTDETVACDAIPAAAIVTAADNCDPTLVVDFSEVNSVVEGCGTIVRTWTVADSCGNSATASQTLTVEDTVAPVLAGVPADETVACDAIPAAAIVTAADNCDPTLVVDFSEVNSVVEGCGTIVRTWTVADSCGNSATASQTVTVEDTVAPVLAGVPADETVACDAIPAAAIVTASDNCDPTLVVDFSEVNNVVEGAGTIVRTWTVADNCGNSATASQTLTVEDTVAPVLAGVPADATVACDAIPAAAIVTAADNCDPTLVVDFSEVNSVVEGCGTIVRTWTVADSSGNSATASQTLTVEDTVAPVLAGVPADETVACDAIPAVADVTAADNCDPTLVVDFSEVNNVVEGAGTIVRTWTVADNCGNSATASQTLTVEDTVAPVLAGVPADATVACDAIPAAAIVTAADNCDPTLVVDFAEVNSVVEGCGTIVRTWTVADSSGNSATASQTLTVEDTVAPVLAGVPADETVACDAIPAAAIVTAADNCDPTLVVDFSEVNSVVEGAGTIVRTWTVADSCGNSATASQTLTVEDTVAPVLAGVPADATVACDAIPAAAIVTAADNCDPTLVVDFSEVNSVVEGCGTIVRTWTVADSSGNSATASQTLTVEDTAAPVLAGVPADATVACDAIPAAAIVTASDNCDPTLVVDFSEVNSVVEGCGTIIRTWTVADNCGNSATASQTLTVEDTVAPVLAGVPADATVACDAIPAAAIVTAADNCDPTLVVDFSEVNSVVEGCGTIVRTWTVADSCGNSATASQTLTVEDTVAPVLAGVPADATYECDEEVPAAPVVTATDNCDPTVETVFSEEMTAGSCPANYTLVRTWTAADSCGNSATASQTITVQDTTAPVITGVANQTVVPIAQPARFKASVDLQFNGAPIPAGRTIWFTSTLKVNHEGWSPTMVGVENSKIEFTANGTTYTINVPKGAVFVKPVTSASTVFNAASNSWETITPKQMDDNVFLVGVAFTAPVNLPGYIKAKWSGDFYNDRLGVTAQWKASAAVYSSFSTDYNALGVKPVDGSRHCSLYRNHLDAGTPMNYRPYVVEGGTSRKWLHHGCGWWRTDYTGQSSKSVRVIPKCGATMSICNNVTVFDEPEALDNCSAAVVTCVPASGSELGPGIHTVTATAVDECGNTSTATFTVTVLQPIRVVFTSPLDDDNIPDNMSSGRNKTDTDWCADAPTTGQVVNRFTRNCTVLHKVKLYNCAGADITSTAPVTVKIDVTERVGTYQNSTLLVDVPEDYSGIGDPAGTMERQSGHFQFNLKTQGYDAGTINNTKFFRSVVLADYNSAPGVNVGIEDAILESR